MTAGRPGAARVVLVSAPPARARRLARALVGRRVAACVQVLPGARSVYRWKGRVEEARESILLVKTTGARLPALLAAVRELHPYEVPEALALPVAAGLPAYLRWLSAEVTPRGRGRASAPAPRGGGGRGSGP